MIFDSHAHYDAKQFFSDREELLSSMKENNVRHILNVGSDLDGCRGTLELARKYDFVYAALGIHPSDISELDEESFAWMRKQVKNEEKVVAVGEIGLDYHWMKEEAGRNQQQERFILQLEFAKEQKLPVVIHSREAAADTLDMVRKHAQGLAGVFHCYSYDWEMAKKVLDLGFYLGITGVVTYKKAAELKEVAKHMPMERLLIETDCPYLAPVPYRGKRNTSLYLPHVINAIAEIKGMEAQEVEDLTFENAKTLFRI